MTHWLDKTETWALRLFFINLALVLVAIGVLVRGVKWAFLVSLLAMLLLICQFVLGLVVLFGSRLRRGWAVTLSAPPLLLLGFGSLAAGAGWGRPLRVRGRQLYPQLCEGSDWTQGEQPRAAGLDAATRAALEALWLHDAQKEHASVPAFARLSWLLAAVGAPAHLVEWAHRAALEEIAHTRLCFALAAGYGGRSSSVEPMPELLLGGLELAGEPLAMLAAESLADGCLLEDFNADVAAACAQQCEEPTTRQVLLRIATEERSHAEFSWALLGWLVGHAPAQVVPAVKTAAQGLAQYHRPTAVSAANQALVDGADAQALRRHGRLDDTEWAQLWADRLQQTLQRLRGLVG